MILFHDSVRGELPNPVTRNFVAIN